MAQRLERKARLTLASLVFRLIRRSPVSANPLKLLGPSPRILVVRQQNQMGDMLLTTPCFRALRESFPESWIALVASDENEEVVRNNPHLSEVLVYSKKRFRRRPWESFRFIATLRNRRFDICLVLSTISLSVTSVLLSVLSRAKCVVSYSGESYGMGFADRAFNVAVPLADRGIHRSRLALGLLEHFGITTQDASLVMVPSEQAETFAEGFISGPLLKPVTRSASPGEPETCEAGPLVGIHPGAGKRENRWPAFRFGRVANALKRESNARILVIAGSADVETTDEMLRELDFEPALLRGETLDRVAAVMKRLSLFICNDTGVLHVAASVGCPTLCLFGPTDPEKWVPIGTNVRTLRAPGSDMEQLAEQDVTALAAAMLSGKGGAGG